MGARRQFRIYVRGRQANGSILGLGSASIGLLWAKMAKMIAQTSRGGGIAFLQIAKNFHVLVNGNQNVCLRRAIVAGVVGE